MLCLRRHRDLGRLTRLLHRQMAQMCLSSSCHGEHGKTTVAMDINTAGICIH